LLPFPLPAPTEAPWPRSPPGRGAALGKAGALWGLAKTSCRVFLGVNLGAQPLRVRGCLPVTAGLPLPVPRGAKHGLTLVRGPTRRRLPWPAGTRTRRRMGQTRSTGRNRLPRGTRAAESAEGAKLGSSNHGLSQLHDGAQEKDVRHPAVTHLPAAIPVSQEPKHYAEDHVAKKHHLRGIETLLWKAHSWKQWAALPLQPWAS